MVMPIMNMTNYCPLVESVSPTINSSNQCWEHLNNSSSIQTGGACTWAGRNFSNGSHGTLDVEDLGDVFAPSRQRGQQFREPRIQHSRHHRVFRKSFSNVSRSNSLPYQLCPEDNTFDCRSSCYNVCPISDKPQQKLINIPCTEAQWLACPVTNCSVFSGNPNSNPNSYNQSWNFAQGYQQPPPCLDGSLNEFEYYLGTYPSYCPLIQDDEDRQCLDDYLSNEKRKEKSRDAARCRRSRETDIFAELAAVLPIPPDQAAHLDKASVMRLAIAYLKTRSVVDALDEPITETESITEMNTLLPEALDGFILVLSSNGDMVYLSENVTDYLGIPHMDMMGQSVYEYSHPCDHDEIREYLSMKPADMEKKIPCSFLLRLKCTLTSKGRKVNLKSASYKVIHCSGRPMMTRDAVSQGTENSEIFHESSESISGSCSDDSQDVCDNQVTRSSIGTSLVVVGCPIPHPSNIEVPLGRQTFLSKHNLNMRFTYADDRLTEHLGWSSNELVGKSVFECYHALDNLHLDKSFKSLFSKGQCETTPYRFLAKTGGYAWIVTQATLIKCSKQQKPLSVVCVNYILSGVEHKNEVYSLRQLEAQISAKQLKQIEFKENKQENIILDSSLLSVESVFIDSIEEENILPRVDTNNSDKRARPQTVTSSIFKDRSLEDKKEIQSFNEITNTPERKEKRSPWTFQDKLVQDLDPARYRSVGRPQAVTRNLFGQENQQPPSTCRPPPQTATASIFAPRTKDMNKGFLTFSDDQPGLTMLKDEPEDLTHLAPTPGDVCVPLEDTPFLSDMLDEFILGNEVYCPLLSPSLPPELQDGHHGDEEMIEETIIKDTENLGDSIENSLSDSDPFFYRDSSSSPGCGISHSSGFLTPILGKSPEPQSVESLYSPENSNAALGCRISEDDILMLSISDVTADEELEHRAPYIPMSDQDEALQLLISDDMVMWGPSQPSEKKITWDTEDDISRRYADSSLAKLLKSTTDELDKRNGGNLVDPVQVLGQNSRKGGSNKRQHASSSPYAAGDIKRIRYHETTKKTCIELPQPMGERISPLGLKMDDYQQSMLSTPYLTNYMMQPESLNSKKFVEESMDTTSSLFAADSTFINDFNYNFTELSSGPLSPGSALFRALNEAV